MGYLALYRRFRPVNFETVIGQDAIVKTLTNQIVLDKVGHAYLFCGARGTGKTSLAKIFAKAVNCLNNKNGSPCGECEACKMLSDPSNVDVIEIDAASNNKVENVRDIRENIQYPPVGVKYKVYIIDEVHMLTTEAFNALLKTLEEPPKHAIFILATTEPHKLPATILSRCMRFDFRLISTKEIASLISKIYDEIGKSYEKEAISLIAKSGEGSVRDALSVADLCVSVGKGKLTYDDVLSVLGATDLAKTDLLVRAIFEGNTGEVLKFTDELYSLGKSIGLLSKDVVNYLRDIAVVKTCKNAKEVLALPDDRFEVILKTANLVDEHRILRCIEIVSSIETSLRYSTQPRAVLETALIKATMPENDYNIDALLARINALEKELKTIKESGVKVQVENKVEVAPKVEVKAQETAPKVEVKKEEPVIQEVKVIKTKPLDDEGLVPPPIEDEIPIQKVSSPKTVVIDNSRCWGGILRKLRKEPQKTILWVACQEMTGEVNGNVLTIYASTENEIKLIKNPDNYNTLIELSKEFGISDIKVLNKEEKQENPLEKAKAFFGDTLEIKN